jgi:hypothetical protein
MVQSADIPDDIWLNISSFILHRALCDLYAVNRVFLNLALNERYREVKFLQVNKKTVKFLRHVK